MAGRFPGMDPYLEFHSSWLDFHNGLIAEIRNELGQRLPASYVARIDERIENVASLSDPASGFQEPEELRLTWVEIQGLPDLKLVTMIEALSPIIKSSHGRGAYLRKRKQLDAAGVNLVEIDLLLAGRPLPIKPLMEPGGYYAVVARASRSAVAEVYRWSVRDSLPPLPIPLQEPDGDVPIDLGLLVNRVYNLGRYAGTLRHDVPLPDSVPLNPDDRRWAESLALRGEGD